jgi:hypothetical protein
MYLCVSLVELSFQTVMGWIPALKCMLSGARGFIQRRPIMSGSECATVPRGPDIGSAYPFSRSPRLG